MLPKITSEAISAPWRAKCSALVKEILSSHRMLCVLDRIRTSAALRSGPILGWLPPRRDHGIDASRDPLTDNLMEEKNA